MLNSPAEETTSRREGEVPVGDLGGVAAAVPMPSTMRRPWLNRNVVTISVSDLLADANYEMVLAILPLFLVIGLGAPAIALGLSEGVADACLAVAVFVSGVKSDRISWRKHLASGGYALTAGGMATLLLVNQWSQVIGGRAIAWIGRGVRKPIRSAMLAGSVEPADLGKAFGLHEALDTLGALLGPALAFLLLATGNGFKSVFAAAVVPGVLAMVFFTLLTRDPRKPSATRVPGESKPLGPVFWRLAVAVGTFGLGNFAVTFLTLRALEMLTPELSIASATTAAVAFFLSLNLVGTIVAFPGGWLVDRLGSRTILMVGYVLFAAACLVGAVGHGGLPVAGMALLAGASQPLVSATESSFVASIIGKDRRGAAFGIMASVNGAGDLVSSVLVGLLWTVSGAPMALAYGGVLSLLGAVLLLFLAPHRALQRQLTRALQSEEDQRRHEPAP